MADMSPLRRRMIEDMTIRNLSPATQQSYVHAVSKFSRYFGRSPDRLGLEDVRAYQVHLISKGISPSARIAAASCAAWGPRRRTNPAPFAATHHDHERRPDLDRLRFPRPPRQFPAGAEVQRFVRSPSACFSLDPVVVATVRAVQTPAAERSNRSAIAPATLTDRAPGVHNQKPLCAFPIATNRPAPSLNPGLCEVAFCDPRTYAPATSHNPPDSTKPLIWIGFIFRGLAGSFSV